MAPIRVGIVGLAGQDIPNVIVRQWGVQHFKGLRELPQYEIVAVCNTSVESATQSIAFHKLDPAKVKAYGSASDLAADPNVDLVAVTIDVDHHMDVTSPMIEAGKDVYLEFPIAPTAAECEELVELARKKGVKVAAGSQAHSDPVMVKLRETLPEIGDVVDTAMVGTSPMDVSQGWPQDAARFLDKDSGLSRIFVVLGHLLGGFSSVVGEFDNLQSLYKAQAKSTTLLDATYQPVQPNTPVTAPDHMLIQGILKSGATASINLRVAPSPVDDVGFRWIVAGTLGEIEVVTKPGFIQGGLTGATIKLRKRGEEAAKVVEWTDVEHVDRVEGFGQSVARAYVAFAEGRTADYATLESALGVHRALERANKGAMWAP